MRPRIKILFFFILSFAFIGCDRVTKDLAKEHLANKETLSYLHDTFRLQYVENTGAALNLGDQLSKTASFWLLSMLPLAFLLMLLGYTMRHIREFDLSKMFCFALIFSGGIGNIIDRLLFDRHVADFMNLGIQNIRTGIFNIADVCVTAGVIGLLFFSIRKKQDTV
jgi:signal peptidase II